MIFLLRHVFLVHVFLLSLSTAARITPETGLGRIVENDRNYVMLNATESVEFLHKIFPADLISDNQNIRVPVSVQTPISSAKEISDVIDLDGSAVFPLQKFQNGSSQKLNTETEIHFGDTNDFKPKETEIVDNESDPFILNVHPKKNDVIYEVPIIHKPVESSADVVVPVSLPVQSIIVHSSSIPPQATDLKFSPSYVQEINSVVISKIPVTTAENNDISPTTLSSKDIIAIHRTKENLPRIWFKKLSSVEPLTVLTTSLPPKHKTKSTIGKQPDAKVNSIEDKWRDLEKKFRSYTDTVMKRALPKFLRIHSQLNISSQCNGALLQMARGLRNLKSWAIKMVDASGRLPTGSLEGTLTDLGEYDQCLDVLQPIRNKHSEIKGQYCTLELKPTLPALHNSVTLNTKVLDFGNASKDSVFSDLSHGSALFHFMVMRIGICVPSPCQADDIRELAVALMQKVPIHISVRNCETKKDVHVTIPQFIVISAAVIIGFFLAAGTLIDEYVSRTLSKANEIGRIPQSLLAFSLRTNLRELFRTTPRKNSTLLAVNGVRCLSLMWIVLAHTYGFGHRQGLARLSHAKTYLDDVLFQIITNAWVSVDTFFLLGGLLVAFSNLKGMENTGGSINFFSHVLHRVWRLTPPLAGTLGLMFLLPMIGSGPLWADMVGQKVANCEKRWWQVFLPVNTWIDFGSMCLLHTWYIAADMHFYSLAPLALIVLYRWPAFGFALLFLLTAVCSLVTGLLTLAYDLPPTVIFFSPDVELTKRTANLIYFRPYPHIGAYCVGLALGYMLWRHRKCSLSKIALGAGWALSCTSCLAVLFATFSWSRGQSAEPAEGITYAVVHRTVWAAGVAWVLFVCATGHGGVLNKFLSWQIFGPLSKLSYSVYLLHFPVLWVRVSWRRTLLNFHHYDIVTEFFGILMITLGLSILFHLAFEAPFLRLEQIWFPQRRKTKTAKPLSEKSTT